MACKGTCIRYKAKRPPYPDTRYAAGQKRCSTCDVFLNWDGKHCPCCNFTLRTRPKGTTGRHQLLLVRQSRKNRLQFNDSSYWLNRGRKSGFILQS